MAWWRYLALVVVLVVVAVAALPMSRVLPLVFDDIALDRVVVAVALDWRDFGYQNARTRLQYELDHWEVGAQVTDEHCRLSVEPDSDLRTVRCDWKVKLVLPIAKREFDLAFDSYAAVDVDGKLVL